jgi:hypothetical protein
MPLLKDAGVLPAASVIQAGRAAGLRSRTIRWKRSTRSRAETNTGTHLSMRATVIASPLVSRCGYERRD